MKYIALLLTSSFFILSCSDQAKPVSLEEGKKIESDTMISDTDSFVINTKQDSTPIKVKLDQKTKKIRPDFNIEYPHGGEQEFRKPSEYDSAEWAKKIYYDSINRLK